MSANITYERLGRRRSLTDEGLIKFVPRKALWWFLLNKFSKRNLYFYLRMILAFFLLKWQQINNYQKNKSNETNYFTNNNSANNKTK